MLNAEPPTAAPLRHSLGLATSSSLPLRSTPPEAGPLDHASGDVSEQLALRIRGGARTKQTARATNGPVARRFAARYLQDRASDEDELESSTSTFDDDPVCRHSWSHLLILSLTIVLLVAHSRIPKSTMVK